jgi:hypothetical protein
MLLSSLGLRLHKPRLFRSKRPVDRALGSCHSLGFDGSSAPYGNARVERDRPFPHVPSNALYDAIFDAAIFHVVKNRSRAFASGMSILPRSSSCRQNFLSMYSSSISRALCSDGMRCIKPLAPMSAPRGHSRNMRLRWPGSRDFPHTPASPQDSVLVVARCPDLPDKDAPPGFAESWGRRSRFLRRRRAL